MEDTHFTRVVTHSRVEVHARGVVAEVVEPASRSTRARARGNDDEDDVVSRLILLAPTSHHQRDLSR